MDSKTRVEIIGTRKPDDAKSESEITHYRVRIYGFPDKTYTKDEMFETFGGEKSKDFYVYFIGPSDKKEHEVSWATN